ncbi:mitochondrial carrier domain-containing protein [Gymnopilus junonius]|uniref:Mitochondrial carrier domain-containing protein n=1 Tax=Gymnopilus junonius TaxID=109634 RepID=A0A9P5NN68_GYMJU|nr:mitochondrial carrier domain-containing protein [Gymnopilus junonius]
MSPNAASAHPDTQSLSYIVRSGLAGGVAGCVAKTVVAPLDRVKILFQASNPDYQKYAGTWTGAFRAVKEINKQQGVRGLFQGHSATLLRVFPYAAIKFMAYDQVHYLLMPTREQETNLRRFLAGAISGTLSVFCTYPLEVVRVRMAFQTRRRDQTVANHRPSFLDTARYIYHEGTASLDSQPRVSSSRNLLERHPILKFYRGFTVTVLGMIPYAGVSFLSWGFLRSVFVQPTETGRKKATPLADLAIGAVSGAISQTASYPFEVTRRRMQVGGITRPDRWLRWGETVKSIWQTSGWRGFYVGLSIGYLKIIPMTAVSFTVWQNGKRMLNVD